MPVRMVRTQVHTVNSNSRATANVACFQRKIQLCGLLHIHMTRGPKLLRISGVLLYCITVRYLNGRFTTTFHWPCAVHLILSLTPTTLPVIWRDIPTTTHILCIPSHKYLPSPSVWPITITKYSSANTCRLSRPSACSHAGPVLSSRVHFEISTSASYVHRVCVVCAGKCNS